MNKKLWLSAASTLVLGTSIITGCGTASTSTNTSGTDTTKTTEVNKDVTITFYEAMTGQLGKTLKKLTDDFQAANPNIHVQLVETPNYTTQKQKLTAAIAGHNEPTIAQVQETGETEYYNNGILQPLDGVISKDTINDLIPIWKDDNSYDGKLVSIPFNKSDYVLYYNTDAFSKAGITNPPTTWDELQQDAKKLTTSNMKGIGLQGNYYTFEMLMMQAGGDVLSADQKTAAFGTDAGKKALTLIHKLAVEDKSASVIGANGYLSDGFNTAKYAMDLDTIAASSFIKNPNVHWKMAPLPGDAKHAVPTAGTNIVMFKSATDDQKKAAAKYMEYLISKDNTIEWAKQTGYLPVRTSAMDDPAWKTYVQSNPNAGVSVDSLKDAYFSPRLASLFSGENNVTTLVGNCLQGSASIDDTLKKSVDAINKALQGN